MKKAVCGIYNGMNKISGVIQKILEAVVVLLVLSCAADLLLQVTISIHSGQFCKLVLFMDHGVRAGRPDLDYLSDGRHLL